MSTVRKKNGGTVGLYWVTTVDHSEDWFILAKSAGSAKRFHENYEGYNRGDANARLVLAKAYLPGYDGGCPPCHAQLSDLKSLGFEVVEKSPFHRVVRLGRQVFKEGYLESLIAIARDNLLQAHGHGRPNGTPPVVDMN